MRKMFLILSTLLAFISALTFNSLAYAGHHEKGEMTPKTVVDLAVGAEATSTLVTAVKAAELISGPRSSGGSTKGARNRWQSQSGDCHHARRSGDSQWNIPRKDILR